MTFIVPDPHELIARYQDLLRPEDPAFGNGIADWTISSEYQNDPQSQDGNGPIWGCMCSPSMLPELVKLQPEDIAAKRAHIILRRPKSIADIAELHRTVLHELGHVLVARMGSENREAEENAMHSFDHFFSKFSPEQSAVLARSFQNPMARAYRAKEGDMPDVIEEDKDKQPDKPAPAMQEGAPRDIATIEQELLAARLANDTAKMAALQDEWFAAKMAATAATPAPVAPVEPPTMGMKPEDAYARKSAEDRKEAIEAIIDANPHLADNQKAMIRKMPTVKDARELAASYPRAANQNDPVRMGMQGNPKLGNEGAPKTLQGGLPAEDSAAMARSMGAKENKPQAPHINKRGRFSMGNMTPTQLRAAIASGNDPRKQFPSTIGD